VSAATPPVHLVLAGGDRTAPSGGDVYHQRLRAELAELGRRVRGIEIPGAWPRPAPEEAARLARALDAVPDGAVALLDGLVACAVPEIVAPQVRRLRLIVLVHLPLATEGGLTAAAAAELDRRERETLHAVHAAVATSAWTAPEFAEHQGAPPPRLPPPPPACGVVSLPPPTPPDHQRRPTDPAELLKRPILGFHKFGGVKRGRLDSGGDKGRSAACVLRTVPAERRDARSRCHGPRDDPIVMHLGEPTRSLPPIPCLQTSHELVWAG
jgi:hypothetical protein